MHLDYAQCIEEACHLEALSSRIPLGAHGVGEFAGNRGQGLAYLSSRVLVSLWEVNDLATPALMKSFYAKLSAGQSVAEALREAKIAMIHSDRPAHRHPHLWAPFVVSGAL